MISDKRFKSLIENSFDVIALYDAAFGILYLSPSFFRLTGFTIEERKNSRALNFAHPEDVVKSRQLMAEVLRRPNVPVPFQNRLLHKQGHYIWVEGVLTNRLDDEDVQAVVANYREISERKEAEERLTISENRFRSIIEEFPFPVVTYDKHGNSLLTNRAWEVMWEDKRENALNYNIRQDPQLIQSGLSVYVEKAFGGEVSQAPPYLYDPALIGKKGRKRWIQMVLFPLKDDSGSVREVILVLLDLTSIKEAEAEILKLNTELEERVAHRTTELREANLELESFSYSVSHDLRAPLRGIIRASELLVQSFHDKLGDEGQDMLDKIQGRVFKMQQLIDDLMNFSKASKTELQKKVVSMDMIVNQSVEDLKQGGVAIPLDLRVQYLGSVECDENLMKQVWINLLSNAIKYSTQRERPVVEVGSYSDNGSLTYYVKDNGVGFDMQYYHKIFKVFQRLHHEKDFQGTGIGLAIVHKIIARHGGKIWAQATKEEGATFYFTLR